MADEGILDDKDDVEGHKTLPATPDPKTDSSDDVQGHKTLPVTSDPETESSDDVEGHSRPVGW